MNNYVIETRNLTKQYETQKSVADLNIHVKGDVSMVYWGEMEPVKLQP